MTVSNPSYWLPPIMAPRKPLACLVCEGAGAKPRTFEADDVIAAGFGIAALTRDRVPVWQEINEAFEDCMTGAQAEALAAADPEHDWRIVIFRALSGQTYQRQGAGNWVLVEQNMGFA